MLALLAALLLACQPETVNKTEAQFYSRLVTLAPSLAELTFTAGAGDKLIGVSAYTDFPPQVADLPLVGDAFTVDQEQLALLAPDLLLAWESGMPKHTVDELRAVGFNVERIRTRSLADISAAIRRIGTLAGTRDVAEAAAARFESDLEDLRARYSKKESISVFYQISNRPLYTVNGEHYISQLIELCGGRNVFADLSELAPNVGVEAVLDRSPEVLMGASYQGSDAYDVWQRWDTVPANQTGNYFQVPADEIGRPTTRVLVAARVMCEALEQARMNRARMSEQ